MNHTVAADELRNGCLIRFTVVEILRGTRVVETDSSSLVVVGGFETILLLPYKALAEGKEKGKKKWHVVGEHEANYGEFGNMAVATIDGGGSCSQTKDRSPNEGLSSIWQACHLGFCIEDKCIPHCVFRSPYSVQDPFAIRLSAIQSLNVMWASLGQVMEYCTYMSSCMVVLLLPSYYLLR